MSGNASKVQVGNLLFSSSLSHDPLPTGSISRTSSEDIIERVSSDEINFLGQLEEPTSTLTLLPKSLQLEKGHHLCTAVEHIKNAQYSQAKTSYELALEQFSNNTCQDFIYRAFCYRGLAHIERGNRAHKEQMYQSLEKASRLLPKDSSPFVDLFIEGCDSFKELVPANSRQQDRHYQQISGWALRYRTHVEKAQSTFSLSAIFLLATAALALIALIYTGITLRDRLIKILPR